MLNLLPNATNNLIVYADTVSTGMSVGNDFTISFTNSYSKETWTVLPTIVRRNSRFVELEIDVVGVTGFVNPINGSVYFYPEGNFEYEVFNTSIPTITSSGALSVDNWNNPGEFDAFIATTWVSQGVTFTSIDQGQAFLFSEEPCEAEIQFVPYEGGNNWLDNIVYVTGIPLYQFPCTIPAGETFTLEQNTVTYCQIITIEGGATLEVPTPLTLTQTAAPYSTC